MNTEKRTGQAIMMKVPRIFRYVGMAGLLLIGLAGICIAEPDHIDKMDAKGEGPMHHQMAGFPIRGPIDILHSGCGFALKDNESQTMRLNIEALLPIEPSQIRMQLASNKSLEEIRDNIHAKDGVMIYRGNLMLDGDVYSLVNIWVDPVVNNSTSVRAEVADADMGYEGHETTNIGSISVIISPTNEGQVGKGELEINSGRLKGKYAVLLDMEPPRHGSCPMSSRI
jgi:hypothetical protein